MPSAPQSEPIVQVVSRPYRGAASYGAADRAFFFGRRLDAETVVSLILSYKLSLLHAVSGMGKTSLLEALALPMLEDQGWITVRCRPHLDTTTTLRRAILDRVVPDPEDEARAIEKTLAIMAENGQPADASIADVLTWFQSLPRDVPSFAALQHYEPPKLGDPSTGQPEGEEAEDKERTFPFVTRLFQYGTGLRLLERQVTALEALAGTGSWVGGSQAERRAEVAAADFAKLLAFFRDPRVSRVHASVRQSLETSEMPLAQFLQRLQAIWGQQYDSFGLVLVLDQFEEIFTRYVDPLRSLGALQPRDAPDWELRPAFFRDLATAVNSVEPSPPLEAAPEAAEPMPPLRIMISMRDDFIANLDQLTQHTGPIAGAAQYHLGALSAHAARQAVVEPARLFGVTYEPALLDTIIDNLAKEKRWVEPGHLQIVCEYLWEKSGSHLAAGGGGTIPMSSMPEADGARGIRIIVSGHFNKILNYGANDRPRSDAQKVEILDLLEPLMTQGGTRNIVEKERLTLAPFRNIELRRELLEELNRNRILRTEPRLGGKFVEITHEFLIGPIQTAMRDLFRDSGESGVEMSKRRSQWARLPLAFRRLDEIQFTFRRDTVRPLDREELATLDTFAELVDFAGQPWIAEAMFRSALMGEKINREEMARHRERFRANPTTQDPEKIQASLSKRMGDEIGLDHAELEALIDAPGWPDTYSGAERTFMLESAIANAWAKQRDLIARIARETIDE